LFDFLCYREGVWGKDYEVLRMKIIKLVEGFSKV